MKTQKEFLKGCEHDGSFVPVNEVKRLMSEYANHVLSEKRKEANDFIIQIAELLGMDTDGIGYDGLQWGIDDFNEALDNVLSEKMKEFAEWVDENHGEESGEFIQDILKKYLKQ